LRQPDPEDDDEATAAPDDEEDGGGGVAAGLASVLDEVFAELTLLMGATEGLLIGRELLSVGDIGLDLGLDSTGVSGGDFSADQLFGGTKRKTNGENEGNFRQISCSVEPSAK
jgi:hypothetical protein